MLLLLRSTAAATATNSRSSDEQIEVIESARLTLFDNPVDVDAGIDVTVDAHPIVCLNIGDKAYRCDCRSSWYP